MMTFEIHARLAADEVDLWISPLPLAQRVESMLFETLSEDERHRAARYVTPRARSQFVASRGVLRQLVQKYLGVPAKRVRLALGAQGKPCLADAHPLSFNTSHTDGLLLVALGGGMPLGVDVEKIRPIHDAARLANRFFSARERADVTNDALGFLRLWTCRESAVKALGAGISAGWDAVRIVEHGPHEAEAIGLGQACRIRMLAPFPGYVAALSALASTVRLRQIQTFSLTGPDVDGSLPC